jgi:hypothetical protein
MKKKPLILMLSLPLALSLVGCQNKAASSSLSSSSMTSDLEAKALDLYLLSPKDKFTGFSLALRKGNDDLPFISLANAKKILDVVLQKGFGEQISTLTEKNQVYTLERPNGGSLVFDFNEATLTYSDFSAFFRYGAKLSFLDPLRAAGYENNGVVSYIQREAQSTFDQGTPYLPLQTVSDFVLNPWGLQLLYNTQAAYLIQGADPGELKDLYYASAPRSRSEALATFNLNELAANLDTFYGLKDEHHIPSFKKMFERLTIREQLLSPDPTISSKATADLIRNYFADFHSGFKNPSFFVGKDVVIKPDTTNPYRTTAYDEMMAYSKERAKVYPDGVPSYEEFGPNKDTAFVTFDHFTINTQNYYTLPATIDAKDTFGIIEYAHSQIFRDGSKVKNVVIDLSCNGGGAVDAAAYVNGWVLDTNLFPMMNTATGGQALNAYSSDVNLDHVFDAKDRISSKNVYLLTSPASFSCGNLVPSLLRSTNKVSILGRTSGGGACMVYPTSTADGSMIQMSGPEKICTVKNGSFYSVDQGVDADYPLASKASFYDRENLASYIDTLK